MSTNFPPIHICLEEAIADLNKLGRNLQSKVDSLKRKRFTPEKLRGRYGYTNISRKLFTICDLSRKSIENVENKVRKSIKTYDNDRRCDSELPCNDLTGARVGLPSGVTLDHYSSCVVEILNKEKYVVDEYKNISSDDSNAEKPPKKKKKVAFSDKLTYIDDLSDGAMQDSENSRHSNGDINGRIKSDKTSTKSKYKENYARLEKSNGIDEADDSSCELVETSNLNNENEKETSEKSANTSEINKCETLKTESKGFIKCVDISKLIASPKHNRIESEVIVLDTPSPKLEKITKQCYTDCKVKIETLEDSDVSSNETKKKRSYERVRRKLTSETERKKTDRSDDSSHAKSGNSRHRDDRQKDRRHGRIDSSNNDKSKSDDAVKSTKDGENPAKKLRLNKDDSAKSKSNESPRSTKRTPPSSNRRKFVLDSDDSVKSNSDDATKNNDKKSKKPQSDNDETVISKSNDERSQSDTGDSGKLKLDNATKSTPSKNKLTRRKALSDSDDNLKSNSNEAAKDNDPTQTDSNDNRNSTKTDAATKEDEVLVERESTPSKKGPKLTRRKALSDSDDSLKSNSNEAAKVNEQTQSESNESGKSTKTDAATKEDEVLVEQESTQLKNGLKPKRGKSSSDSNDNVKSTSNKTATDDDQMSDAEESGKSKSNNNKVTNEDELVPQKSTQSKKRLQLTRRSDSEDSVKSNSNVAAEDDERTQSDSEDSVKSNSNEAAEDDDQTQSNCETAEDAERSKSDDNAISKSNHAIKEDELLVERKSTPSKKRLQLIRRKSLSDSEDSAKSKSNVDAENDERMDSDDATKEDELLIERKLTPSKKGLQLVRGKQLSDSDDSVKTNSNEVAKNDEGTQSDADVSVKPKSDNTPNEDDLLIMRNATLSIKELLSGSDDNGKSKRKSQTHVSPKSDRQSARRKLLPSSDDNVVSDDNAKDVDLQIDLSDLQIDKVKKEILSNTHVASVQITPFSSLRTLMKEYKLSRITKCGRTIMKQSVSSDACAKQSLLVNSSTESERSSENVSADDSDSDIMKELSQTRRKMLKKRAKNTANSADTDSDIDNDQKQLKSDLTPDEQSEEMGRSQRIKTRTQTSNNEKSDSSAGSKGKDSDINRMANLNNLNKQNRPKDSRSSDSGPDKAKKRKTNNLPKEVEENGIDDVELEEDEPSSDNCMVEESFELAKESDKNKTAANGGTDAAELAKMELLDSNETDDEQTEEKEKKKKTKSVKEPEDSSSSDTKSRAVKKSKGRPVDKLLTGKLSEDSTSDDNKKATDESSDNIRKTKKKSKTVIGSDSDNDSEKKKKEDSDSQSSNKSEDESKHSTNSGSEDDFKPNRRKARKKTKGSSDESSDESKKGKKKRSRIKKRAEDSDESGAGSDSEDDDGGKKGRKNIRRVLGKGDLEETTIRAEKEERLRRQRIADRQKQYNSVMFDESGKPEDAVVDKVVLDFDPDTKEPIIEIDRGIVKKLKPHQANGIKFMWDACFESVKQIEKRKGSGCILAHCMGLGKTLQVIALIHTLLKYSDLTKTRRVLVVCPLSTVLNWVNEFKLWLKFAKDKDDIPIYEISRYKQNHERAYQLQEWIEEGGVCVLGYEMFRNLSADNTKKFKKKMLKSFQESLVDPGPDMVICDEGHLLKNEKTSLSQSMNRITTRRRIVLTGTPLQNNLKEYYCMVQFVKPNLLGKYNEYLNRFVNPITNGQYTDSTDHDIRIMKRRSHVLHKLLDGAVQRRDYGVLAPFLPPKQEYVVFITVTEVQAILYQHYLDNYSRRPHPDRKNSGFLFPDFQALQRIWTHPLVMKANSERYEQLQQKKRDKEEEEDTEGSLADFLDDDSDADTSEEETSSSSSDSLSDASDNSKKKKKKEKKANKDAAAKNRSTRANPVQKDSEDAGKGDDDEVVEVETKAENPTEWWMPIVGDLDLEDLALSNKLVLLFDILRQCEAIGDKVLVFSQSLYSLDLIEHFLSKIDEATQKDVVNEKLCGHTGSWSEGLDYFRLDGQTSCENRSIWCKSFNKPSNPRARLFLISTRAGGLGINLVAANRVIIFDVSWNPSHDVQSIFRIYRFGQKKPCYIYRFLAMGTMEEKIYERQVTKQAISKRVIDEQQIDRHYAENDLAELYIFTPEPEEPRPTPSLPKDRLFAEMIKNYEKLIYKYHEHDSMLENKEEETLTEEERKAAWDDFENEKNKPPPVANFPNMMMPMMNMGHDGLGNTGQMSLVVNHMMGLIRKDNPTLSEQQLSAMIPILFSRASQMDQSQAYPGYDYAKMNPMYYQQNQHVSPNMMPGLSGVHGAMPGLGGYSWQQQQQLANMQRIQQQQQQAAMGMKFYAGGLGSRDPVSMAEAQIRNREMSSGGSELPRRGRPPITARPIISADVVDVEDSE